MRKINEILARAKENHYFCASEHSDENVADRVQKFMRKKEHKRFAHCEL